MGVTHESLTVVSFNYADIPQHIFPLVLTSTHHSKQSDSRVLTPLLRPSMKRLTQKLPCKRKLPPKPARKVRIEFFRFFFAPPSVRRGNRPKRVAQGRNGARQITQL